MSDDPKLIGNILNEYFSTIGHLIFLKLQRPFPMYLDRPHFLFDPVTPQRSRRERRNVLVLLLF